MWNILTHETVMKDVLLSFVLSTVSLLLPLSLASAEARAIFAAGCFWCIQPPFDREPGVIRTVVGYTGGSTENPTYEQVSSGVTGHTEAIEVYFDPAKVTYPRLLEIFWRNIDPTRKDGQFCDKGTQYRPEIFVVDEEQRQAAEYSKSVIAKSRPELSLNVSITSASPFTAAESYHQAFYKKNPERYAEYREGCRRDARLKEIWGDSKPK
jgi:peptide-methionine (S)-S-oxide reductase